MEGKTFTLSQDAIFCLREKAPRLLDQIVGYGYHQAATGHIVFENQPDVAERAVQQALKRAGFTPAD